MQPADLHSEAFSRNPSIAWRELRDEHPVFYDDVDRVYVLSRHEDVRWAFAESPELSNRIYDRTLGRVFGPTLLQMDGHEHVQRRKLVAPQMMGGRLAEFEDRITEIAAQVVDDAASEGPFDLVDRVARRLPGTVIASLLGLPPSDLPNFFEWYDVMMTGLWTDPELRRRGREAHREFQEYLDPLIARRRRQPGQDLISRLLAAEVDGERLSEDELGSFVSLLLTAGGETTDKAISNMWWILLTHRDEYAMVRSDPSRLDAVFSETMRLHPPLVYLGREALASVERSGVTIPAGAVVRLATGSANLDERVFADPDRFWPDRPDLRIGKELRSGATVDGRASHLAFAAGPHFCLGYELARFETVAVSRHILRVLGAHPEVLDAQPPIVASPSQSCHRLIVRPGA
jgi:cytochrome P450